MDLMPHRLLSIGAFSRAAGLSVKTLRLYHERGLLVPSSVDEQTGYRYYAPGQTERAAVIRTLRELEFPLDDIGAMLAVADDDADVLAFLESQRERIESRLQELRRVKASLDPVIRREQKVKRMNDGTFEVTEKTLEPMLVGGIRTRGRYADIGPLFGQLGRKLGRNIRGKTLGLYYDESYREENADFEACMPLKRRVTATGVDVRELPGSRALTLLYRGPYSRINSAYGALLEAAQHRGLRLQRPSREVYLKGPGMIFKGNPERYLTEIQFLVE